MISWTSPGRDVWLLPTLAAWLGTMSFSDLRTRQVSNWLTLPPLLGILAWQLAHGRWQVLVSLPLIYSLWRLGILGGADAKVLMALFGLWPTLEFAVFFCLGYVIIALPILAWRRRRQGKPLLSERTPAVPIYSAIALAYLVTTFARDI
ncbi:MAG TPA: A24 family peptidase [Anaerolineae bacterium]|nr:A24 family peptidase [Anaerolineae bacterium]